MHMATRPKPLLRRDGACGPDSPTCLREPGQTLTRLLDYCESAGRTRMAKLQECCGRVELRDVDAEAIQ